MNNDFENKNDLEKEVVPNQTENTEKAVEPERTEPVSEPANEPTAETTADACPTVSENQPEAEETQPSERAAESAASVSTPEISNVSYNPQSNTYSYSRPDNGGEQVNGCAWNNTGAPVHAKPQKSAKKSSKGFKIFTASMLTVFTVSAVAIASFMAADFVNGTKKADNVVSNATTEPQGSSGATTLISTFKDAESGLTKSQVAAKCSPSTVGIVVEAQTSSGNYYGYFGNFYSQPQITQGTGSGFIYSKDGYIITNHHVVEGATKITVYLSDDTQVEATLIGSDELSDIAVIKIDPTGLDLVPMEIGDSDRLVVGDEVIAIGCPAGIQFRGTVTDGIISAINRYLEERRKKYG